MHVRGRVTGIQPYGAFVSLDEHHQGLIHISECKYGFVGSITDILHVGQVIDVVVLDIDEYTQKISLSLRCIETPHASTVKRVDVGYVRKHYWTKRSAEIGFKPIAQQLDGWKEEALENITK
ncbi:S1 RNA-binding domain-containing protein [Periweissella cryptocerci]|uniref:S1 RNA-binding domain-containing protein n=1 Tax=Periweissella cryptocerci TaxID=2506420 RepID=A0A4P6YXA4_9LACO|nr:CvfD/Ygs/GSP13 family RNA-binding post-transcriptional regulator [Periweissella cryptocerci]QBO37500.1 S1 RNA-binding domain-containing protein [Periweissella cryptocerci]